MPNAMKFTFSDLIAGTVTSYRADEDTFTLQTIDGYSNRVIFCSVAASHTMMSSAPVASSRPSGENATVRP